MNPGGLEKPARRKFAKDTVAAMATGVLIGGALLEVGDDVRRSGRRFLEVLLERRKLLSRERGWEGLSKEEREAFVEREVRDFKAYLRLEGDAILGDEKSTDSQVLAVLRALPWYTHRQLQGTKYDFAPEDWPSVSLSRRFAPKGAGDSIVVSPLDGRGNVNHLGNGSWIRMPDGKLSLLTNIHVLASVCRIDSIIDTSALEIINADELVDAVLVRFTDEHMRELESAGAVPAEFSFNDMPNDDAVHGALLRLPAIDKDAASTSDGRKLYASVGLRITGRLRRFFAEYSDSVHFSDGDFIYASPPGEGRNLLYDRRGFLRRLGDRARGVHMAQEKEWYGQGTSGTVALISGAHGDVVGGINWGLAGRVVSGADVFDFKVMNGPGVIRAVHEHNLVLDMNNPPLTRDTWGNGFDSGGYDWDVHTDK